MKTETRKPETMTIAQCRGWLAEDEGFRCDTKNACRYSEGWYRMENGQVAFYARNPVSDNLDAATRCLPDGFYYTFKLQGSANTGMVVGNAERGAFSIEIADTDEVLVRFRLAVACRMFLKNL